MSDQAVPGSRPHRFLTPDQHARLWDELADVRRRKADLGTQIAETSDMFSGEAEGNALREDFLWLLREETRINTLLQIPVTRDGDSLHRLPDTDNVQLGVTVTVEVLGEQETFAIVTPREWRPGEGLISFDSPIGQALLGGKVGDSVSVKSAGSSLTYRIVSIEG